MKIENIKKVCVKCGAKCCFLGGPTVTKKERDEILKAGFEDVFVSAGKYYDLKSKNDRCPFLRNKLCIIHNPKTLPLMCKIWPVYPIFRGRKRKLIVLDCPLTKYLSKEDIQKFKNLAKNVPKEIAIGGITTLSQKIKKRLNKFGWDEKVKEVLK